MFSNGVAFQNCTQLLPDTDIHGLFIQFNQFQLNTSSTAGLGVETSCTVSNQIGVLATNPLGNVGAFL